MHRLAFANPVGLKSENFTTVRIGEDWGERTHSLEDRVVELIGTDNESLGTAKVWDCWVGPLHALPAIMLEASHDPICRTWSGVAQVLHAEHPDAEVGYDTTITVLRLSYTGSIIKAMGPKLVLPQ